MISPINDKAIYNKLVKLCSIHCEPACPICHEPITTDDIYEIEYVKTKRGTEIYIHTNCVKEWGK